MTREIALHCMKSASELERELCEECPIYGQTGSDHCFEDALQHVIGMLEQEPRWIPVSERLPNWNTECLVIDGDGECGVGYYREDAHAWDSPNWGWLERKDRVDNKEAFTEPCGIGKVIAWMPLKPYEPQESEE